MRERLEDALKKSDAEYTDIRIEDFTNSRMFFPNITNRLLKVNLKDILQLKAQ